jgi:hypothetical protein
MFFAGSRCGMQNKSLQRATSSPLVCKIRKRKSSRGSSATAGEVELENVSRKTLEFEVSMTLFQYLDLVVLDANGAVVSDGHYGDIFSPLAESYVFSLKPGQKYTHTVSLVGKATGLKAGDYIVQAVFEYRDLKAVSEPLAVHLPEIQDAVSEPVAAKH